MSLGIRRTSAVFTLAATAAVASLLLLVAATPALAKKGKPAQPLYWGGVIGKQLTGEAPPWDLNALTAFEQLAGKGASLLAFSSPFADCSTKPCTYFPFPTQAMETLRERGTIPLLSWASQSVPAPPSLKEPRFQLLDVARGVHDEYIEGFAEQVHEWGKPFFLRFDHEMNGFWFSWGEGVNNNKRGSFVKAWRHVHDIFTKVGATNATWVWCPNVDFTRKLTPLRGLYPGGRYVDWTCLDGFNWGETHNSGGWMSFEDVYRESYNRVLKLAPRKPMMIGEMASEERGGSKAAWIRHALKIIPSRFAKVRAMIWFEENDRGMRWPIESSKAATKAFAKAIRRPVYRPNEFQAIEVSPIPPPSWLGPLTWPSSTGLSLNS
jgi:mannan endo-1,4-beta-mannosidase